ncbi:MAG: alanine:cation symporter family protein [Roseofilum sp. SBFL]|uniref:alanine/glycine:cation symporter family protein n=1 Tax=unclassified Roseofilum TaxID=2620099 RepID=UPI001B19CD77|nr:MULTISPECIES: alanine/glycine:cation symporter family protein [unclassified Roseofilum]MBP0015666.1 alanine:cation symporter family protein [Roseofilum sp. SID3]MBP0022581.1 alanine:cation symporter family protein [Roseofilum sp. SID2]MBP0036399.1 alanine:cation symporter family protein [Roseofilum sp. SID1]MBP0044491.1 alanine:cation symporter family protein [Roseofilum sp. SBFL]
MLSFLNDLIWGKILVVVLVPIGLYFSIRSRFVQFRYFGQMLGNLQDAFAKEEGHLSSFQALALSVAGRVGGGNIAGVAVAITLGGPGAIFWMWMIGLVGMATSFFECMIAQVFKTAEPDGSYRGGPAYYMERGLKQPWMASIFSILLLVTFGFGFNAVQSYTVATSFQETFGLNPNITGFALMVVLGIIIFGGVKRIAEVAEYVVPFMAMGYFLLALFVIVTNLGQIPAVFTTIVQSAFGVKTAIAGGVGTTIMYGIKRGLFSNEAGLGSAPNVAAIAYVKHPVEQGIVQALSVFIDTLILCSCTAFVILLSSVYEPGNDALGGVTLTQQAMAEHIGWWGQAFITIALFLFAFTSIIYNYYLGENSLNFFSNENKTLFNVFRVLTLTLVIWGAVQDLGTVFGFADVTMGLLALVNLAALLLLSNVGFAVLDDYDLQIKNGQTPVFVGDRFASLAIDPQAWVSEAMASSGLEAADPELS